jgi:cobyrinic acid a,c-diamide synthase
MGEHSGAPGGYLISAPWRSSGKTLVSIGLAREAYKRQLSIQPFKKGPDFIDPLWLAFASGRPCYNLDPWFQQTDEIIATYQRQVAGGALGLVEGTMGLHDGLHNDGSDSNAAIARVLGLDVLLVVDCRGMHRTIAALVNGLQQFDPALSFAGVILNRIRSTRHGSKIRAAIKQHCDLAVLGEIPETHSVHIAEKQLGLVPAPEFDDCTDCVESIATLVRDHCDLEHIFSRALPQSGVAVTPQVAGPARLTIGIAKDEAFHFYYQDDLDCLRARGVQLVEFSPMRDPLPEGLDGILIGGGFPERHAVALAQNSACRSALKAAIEAGLAVHAECAGLMYLCKMLRVDGRDFELVGAFDATVTMQEKPVGRGYVVLNRLSDGHRIAAHEFHHSQAQFDSHQHFAYAVERGYGIDGTHDGVIHHNAHASYAHFRHTRQTPWVDEFLSRVESGRQPAAVLAATHR